MEVKRLIRSLFNLTLVVFTTSACNTQEPRPTGYEGADDFMETTGARVVTQTQSYTLYSITRR